MKIDKRLKMSENGILIPKRRNRHSQEYIKKHLCPIWNEKTNKWNTYIYIGYTKYFWGSFNTEEEAKNGHSNENKTVL